MKLTAKICLGTPSKPREGLVVELETSAGGHTVERMRSRSEAEAYERGAQAGFTLAIADREAEREADRKYYRASYDSDLSPR